MEYLTSIVDRETLKKYILSKLGGSYDNSEASHDVELRMDQLENIIDDTMQEFLNEIYDGNEKYYLKLDTSTGISKYTLPKDVLHVNKIFLASATDSVFSQAFFNQLTDAFFVQAGYTYVDYQILNFHLNQIEYMTRSPVSFSFNSMTKILKIFDVRKAPSVLLDITRYIGDTESEFETLYSHPWIKKMCEARAWLQWYKNLIKYKGQIFDGNLELDRDSIKEVGDKMYEEANLELKDKYSNCFGSIYSPGK